MYLLSSRDCFYFLFIINFPFLHTYSVYIYIGVLHQFALVINEDFISVIMSDFIIFFNDFSRLYVLLYVLLL